MGQGYRPEEYHALDRDWAGRGAQIEHVIETLLTAWRGEPFEYRGRARACLTATVYTAASAVLLWRDERGRGAARRSLRPALLPAATDA